MRNAGEICRFFVLKSSRGTARQLAKDRRTNRACKTAGKQAVSLHSKYMNLNIKAESILIRLF